MVLLYHNIDRVWVVTKVILPKLEDITFPDVKFDADCSFVNKICDANPSVKTIIQSMCKSMKPLITLIKQKEKFYEMAISVHIEGRNTTVSAWQSQLSAWLLKSGSCLRWSEIFCAVSRERCLCLFCRKKAISAFIPAIASLAKIAVESLSTFLQQKRNKAMAQGLNAIRNDQSLAWNSLKQLEK